MSAVSFIQACFRHAANQQKYRNKWFSDVAWQQIMINHYNLQDFNKHKLNTALQNTTLCHPLKLYSNKKQIKKEDKTRVNGYFYFIADKDTKKELRNRKVDWQYSYYSFTLPRVTKKEKVCKC